MPYKTSAPGSLMLLGEYAVLYGKPALVCAVDKRIYVTLTPRQDKQIHLYSPVLGTYTTDIANIEIEKPFQFILGSLKQWQSKLTQGCDIHVEANFAHTVGLGSSAAVTTATLAALNAWLGMTITQEDLVLQGRNVVRLVQQGVGSGADIAASVFGGVVHYQAPNMLAEKFAVTYPITVWYSGTKTPTAAAIQQVQQQFSKQPDLFNKIISQMSDCVVESIPLVRREMWKEFGELMAVQQNMLELLGVSTTLLRQMVARLRAYPSILGAKISGSGLGDCVLGLGHFQAEQVSKETLPTTEFIPAAMTLEGVHCEEI